MADPKDECFCVCDFDAFGRSYVRLDPKALRIFSPDLARLVGVSISRVVHGVLGWKAAPSTGFRPGMGAQGSRLLTEVATRIE